MQDAIPLSCAHSLFRTRSCVFRPTLLPMFVCDMWILILSCFLRRQYVVVSPVLQVAAHTCFVLLESKFCLWSPSRGTQHQITQLRIIAAFTCSNRTRSTDQEGEMTRKTADRRQSVHILPFPLSRACGDPINLSPLVSLAQGLHPQTFSWSPSPARLKVSSNASCSGGGRNA